MILAIVNAALAVCLLVCGTRSGGWTEELGRVYYCFAICVGSNALEKGLNALGGKR